MRRRFRGMLTVLAGYSTLLLLTSSASADFAINLDFADQGELLPIGGGSNIFAGGPPSTPAGGGSLADIFQAAADWWVEAYADDFTLTLHFGWSSLGDGGPLAAHTLIAQGGTPNRETEGTIRFNNDFNFFLDATPHDNSEYQTFTESTADLGGGTLNTGRVFTDPAGDAAGRYDLLTLAKHEIGHSLGLSLANDSFAGGDITVGGSLPFAGSVIPVPSGSHIGINTSLMASGLAPGVRKVQSGVDILANAQISQFQQVNLSLLHTPVPEPPALIVWLSMGAFGILFVRWSRKKTRKCA